MIKRKFVLIMLTSTLFVLCASGQEKRQIEDVKSRQPLLNFNYSKPIFELNDEQLKNEQRLLRFSVLTGYREGVAPVKGLGSSGAIVDKDHGTSRFYMVNLSIQEILNLGFWQPNNRVILEVKDPSKYRYVSSKGSKMEWMKKNAYCFEYLFPYGTLRNTKIIKDELAYYFNVTFGFEKRLVDALILVKESDQHITDFKKEAKEDLNPVNKLSKLLEEAELPPLVDECGCQDSVNIVMKGKRDFSDFREALRKYGLDLRKEKRELEMFIIRENQIKK